MSKLIVELYDKNDSMYSEGINSDTDLKQLDKLVFKDSFLKTIVAEIDNHPTIQFTKDKVENIIDVTNKIYDILQKEAIFKISNPSPAEFKVSFSEEISKIALYDEYDINNSNLLLVRGGSEKNFKDTINKFEKANKSLFNSIEKKILEVDKQLEKYDFNSGYLNEYGNISIEKVQLLRSQNIVKLEVENLKDITKILNNKTAPQGLKDHAIRKSKDMIEKISCNSAKLDCSYNIVVFKEKNEELFKAVKKEFNKEYEQLTKKNMSKGDIER